MNMAGNASEWVESFYQPYAGNQTTDPNFGITQRVIRGGDVLSKMDDARTTRRQYAPPDMRERIDTQQGKDFKTAVGFRCAISADDPRLQESLSNRR